MARSGTARTGAPDGNRDQQSLGDLVSLALKDVSQLVRYEITLAKKEFKVDLRRAGLGAAFVALVLIVAFPLLIMLLFAYAYGLYAIGVPGGLWVTLFAKAPEITLFDYRQLLGVFAPTLRGGTASAANQSRPIVVAPTNAQ